MRQRGFTVLELIVVIVFLAAAATVFFVQKRDLQVAARDSERKIAINAMYYNLEEIYYPGNQSYPEVLTTDNLRGIDPELLNDPQGVTIGTIGSNYRYEPNNCEDGQCQSYVLIADLEHEADFVRESRN